MRIVQLSDLHVKSGRALAFNAADSASALEATVAHLAAMKPAPDCVVITGDLAEHGEVQAYQFVAATLARLAMPIHIVPGNHDNRENMRRLMGKWCPADPVAAPSLCYTVEDGPIRLIMLDTSAPASHSGHLHEAAARWLGKVLHDDRRPTLVFGHHPPFASGLGVMDEPFEHADDFARIMRECPWARYCCGHLHRGLSTQWDGGHAVICPPLVMHIELDLSPEGGDAFTLETPGYLLHHWCEGRVNTHFCQVPGVFERGGPFSFSNPPKIH